MPGASIPPVLGVRTLMVATTLTLATSSQGLFTTASKTGGKYLYNFSTVPLLSEMCKLMVSSILLYRQFKRDPHGTNITLEWKTTRTYPIPSLIYLVHNNVQFLTLKYVDPSTYQILGNLKIVTTGILFRVFLKRKLSKLQWWALVLLMVGATVSQISGCGDKTFAAPMEGYALGLVSASLSALAGVYTEFIMKQNDDCLYWQNVQLYSFGVLFNAVALTLDDVNNSFSNGFWPQTMFNGYTAIVWCVVFNLAFTGLLVSWIMKFADTIVNVYSTSMAMLVTMLISAWLFNMQPNLQLLLGIVTASASLNLYYMNPRDLLPEREPAVSRQLEKAQSVSLENPEEKALKNADD
jgi:UDP-sugar transporter A1/2/3